MMTKRQPGAVKSRQALVPSTFLFSLNILLWPRELNTLQIKKIHANKQKHKQLRKISSLILTTQGTCFQGTPKSNEPIWEAHAWMYYNTLCVFSCLVSIGSSSLFVLSRFTCVSLNSSSALGSQELCIIAKYTTRL